MSAERKNGLTIKLGGNETPVEPNLVLASIEVCEDSSVNVDYTIFYKFENLSSCKLGHYVPPGVREFMQEQRDKQLSVGTTIQYRAHHQYWNFEDGSFLIKCYFAKQQKPLVYGKDSPDNENKLRTLGVEKSPGNVEFIEGFEFVKELNQEVLLSNGALELVTVEVRQKSFGLTKVAQDADCVGEFSFGDLSKVKAPCVENGHKTKFEIPFSSYSLANCLLHDPDLKNVRCQFENNEKIREIQPINNTGDVMKQINGTSFDLRGGMVLSFIPFEEEREVVKFRLTCVIPPIKLIVYETKNQTDALDSNCWSEINCEEPDEVKIEYDFENELLIKNFKISFKVSDPGVCRSKELLPMMFYQRSDDMELFKFEVTYHSQNSDDPKPEERLVEDCKSFGVSQTKACLGYVISDGVFIEKLVIRASYICSLKASVRGTPVRGHQSGVTNQVSPDYELVNNCNAKQFWSYQCLNGLKKPVQVQFKSSRPQQTIIRCRDVAHKDNPIEVNRSTDLLVDLKGNHLITFEVNDSRQYSNEDIFLEDDYRCYFVKDKQNSNSGTLYHYLMVQFNSEFVREKNRERIIKPEEDNQGKIDLHFILENTKEMQKELPEDVLSDTGRIRFVNLYYGKEEEPNLDKSGKNPEFEASVHNRGRKQSGRSKAPRYYRTIDQTINAYMKPIPTEELENITYGFHANKSWGGDFYDFDDVIENFESLLKSTGENDNYAQDLTTKQFNADVVEKIIKKINNKKLGPKDRREIIIVTKPKPKEFMEKIEQKFASLPRTRIQRMFVGWGSEDKNLCSKNDVECISRVDKLERYLGRKLYVACNLSQREFLHIKSDIRGSSIEQLIDQQPMASRDLVLRKQNSIYWSENGFSFADQYERKLMFVFVGKQQINGVIRPDSEIKLKLKCNLENQKFNNAEEFDGTQVREVTSKIITVDDSNKQNHHQYLYCLGRIDREKLIKRSTQANTANNSGNNQSAPSCGNISKASGHMRQQSETVKKSIEKELQKIKGFMTVTGRVKVEDKSMVEMLEKVPTFNKYKTTYELQEAATLAIYDYYKSLYNQKILQAEQSTNTKESSLTEVGILLQKLEKQATKVIEKVNSDQQAGSV